MDELLAAKVAIERHPAEVGDFGNKSEENRSRCQRIERWLQNFRPRCYRDSKLSRRIGEQQRNRRPQQEN